MDNKSICILGRLPGISTAELESLYGYSKIEKISDEAVIVDIPADEIDFARLGGTIKLTKLLYIFDHTDWGRITDYLVEVIPEHIGGKSKLILGISTYGINMNSKKILSTGLILKKSLRRKGVSTRIVPNKEPALSSAQVFHNKLTSDPAWELCFIKSGNKVYMSKTVAVQDIDAYTARDQNRPKRDARVGMLPPKLAQTIVNLASPGQNAIVLDPFCGTGVILQEALLMGYRAYGTDIDKRMIEYSKANTDWLTTQYSRLMPVSSTNLESNKKVALSAGDACELTWDKFDAIASEAYLGRPFSSLPNNSTLSKTVQDVSTIISKFLQNVAKQTSPGFRICIAVPAWKRSNEFLHLPMLDSLAQLGYTRMSFDHASNSQLIYYREDQVVARELLVLIRK